ncbi:YihY/virulence factor BrkB family protein [Chloroflexia bacterium SDU3-3]|nr:YihY/virulence factor BrkB family protein [Chloroflexia bacterium SDU3-3]
MDVKRLFGVFKDAFAEWNEDKVPRLAAALAYFTVFSIAPLLLITMTLVSFFYASANEQIRDQLGTVIPGGGEALGQLLDSADRSGSTGIAAVIGIVTLLFGASGFFGQLQDALNTIWEVQPKPGQGLMETLKQRFFSFTMVLGSAFLLLVSLVISTALSIVVGYFHDLLPGADFIWPAVSMIVTFVVVTGIFALIFKVIPDAKVAWRDVGVGAAVTALLFMIGQVVLNIYLSNQSNAYGTVGSLIVLLLWVFYSAQILFFGAEFTQVYARTFGAKIEPASNAVSVSEASREKQGMPRTGETSQHPAAEPAPRAVPVAGKPSLGALGTIGLFLVGLALGKGRKRATQGK